MFENIIKFFKKLGKNQKENSGVAAKERLHLVLAQDRANISADFLEMMKQEIIEVIKKYIDIDEEAIDVRMTNKQGEDGIVGAPALYANIPILTIKNEARKLEGTKKEKDKQQENEIEKNDEESMENKKEEIKEEVIEEKQEDNIENEYDKKEEIEEEKEVSYAESKKENVKEGADEKKDS